MPLVIGGRDLYRDFFPSQSPFYPETSVQVSEASRLDLSAAIGCARQAQVPDFPTRAAMLRRASELLSYSQNEVEHTVRMTGMPTRVVDRLFQDIPRWLQAVPQQLTTRFGPQLQETIDPNTHTLRQLVPLPGFCYAVTPANDPRSSALVAANLCSLGIPFILHASAKDIISVLVVHALLQAGFDPNFCSLVYFPGREGAQKHLQLVEAANVIWTFGPPDRVDSLLRFGPEQSGRDRFAGKTVIRHDSGSSATILAGELTPAVQELLWQSICFPLGCTATRNLLVLGNSAWQDQAADWVESLIVGDPLDPATQIGTIQPNTLDAASSWLRKAGLHARVIGGERLSAIQARPALVICQEELIEQTLPAYLVSGCSFNSFEEAVQAANHAAGEKPRLSVALLNLKAEARRAGVLNLRAHAILVDQPTSLVTPGLHEGNDYASLLTHSRAEVGG